MPAPELHFMTLVQISNLIRTGAVTSLAATQATLERIDRIDPALRSYVEVCRERALERAAVADEEISRGIWKGPLHGVPVAVKDLCYRTYAPTAAGTKVHAGFLPP
ncbi:amidase [Rhizobium azibense]|uniref:Amidase n=1 Tax=Rhizobium azibense TaxID=1136135 RepID=A0A4R3RHK8_9HYPH|nr:amidase family protein [Rhizobium azibense]TCU30836.1 amidase [Rhizobium azibense]